MDSLADLLIVDDDVVSIQLLGRLLGELGTLRFSTSGEQALQLARARPPDLILLDAEMPGLSGLQTCAALKAEPELADVPVIFITSRAEEAMELEGLAAGAADFIAKPVRPALLLARARTQLRLKRLTDQLKRVATHDALTGIANRRRFDELLALEWARLQRAEPGASLALILADVDHFKRYNDRHGHPAGDAVLRAVAQAMAGALHRPYDLLARYGGEEFALLLPQADAAGARAVAERLLAAVRALALPHADSPTAAWVTISLGLACANGERPDSAAALLAEADAALYRAKAGGRDRGESPSGTIA